MTDRVIPLRTVPRAVDSAEGMLHTLRTFIVDNGMLSEWDSTDVDLDGPATDEQLVGALNSLEKDYYIIGQLLQQVVRDELVEIEAGGTDQIARIMREQRINMLEAAKIFQQNSHEHLTPDQQAFINKCALTIGQTMTMYEWSVRQRFNAWSGQLIVRAGYVAYRFNYG